MSLVCEPSSHTEKGYKENLVEYISILLAFIDAMKYKIISMLYNKFLNY